MPQVDAGGIDLYYERSGSGEPLLMIQGMSATHLAWGRPFLTALEGDFECIAFDNRGIGRSGRVEPEFTISDLAADAVALLDALGLESVHLLGISMGGMIAQEVALAIPDRIRTLTLGATYCGGPGSSLMRPEDVQALLTRHGEGPEAVRRLMWELNLSPTFRAEESRYAAFEEMAAALPAPAPIVVAQMRATVDHDTSDRLGSLPMPTLVVHGDEDRIIGVENGRQIARLVGVEPTILAGIGHMFWWEQPEPSAELLRELALSAPA